MHGALFCSSSPCSTCLGRLVQSHTNGIFLQNLCITWPGLRSGRLRIWAGDKDNHGRGRGATPARRLVKRLEALDGLDLYGHTATAAACLAHPRPLGEAWRALRPCCRGYVGERVCYRVIGYHPHGRGDPLVSNAPGDKIRRGSAAGTAQTLSSRMATRTVVGRPPSPPLTVLARRTGRSEAI